MWQMPSKIPCIYSLPPSWTGYEWLPKNLGVWYTDLLTEANIYIVLKTWQNTYPDTVIFKVDITYCLEMMKFHKIKEPELPI